MLGVEIFVASFALFGVLVWAVNYHDDHRGPH